MKERSCFPLRTQLFRFGIDFRFSSSRFSRSVWILLFLPPGIDWFICSSELKDSARPSIGEPLFFFLPPQIHHLSPEQGGLSIRSTHFQRILWCVWQEASVISFCFWCQELRTLCKDRKFGASTFGILRTSNSVVDTWKILSGRCRSGPRLGLDASRSCVMFLKQMWLEKRSCVCKSLTSKINSYFHSLLG